MDSLKIKALSITTNRSVKQIEFLLSLCDNDFEKLLSLEQKLKENFISYSPGNKEIVEKILKMDPKKHPWKNIIKEYMINLFKLNKLKEPEVYDIPLSLPLGKNQEL